VVPSLESVRERIVGCERCLRLRSYCRRVGEVKKAAYRDQEYWARPVPGFGDPDAEVLVIGLAPAAHGANRTGRVFTGDGTGGSGDFLMRAMHAAGFASLPFSRSPDDGLTLKGAFISSAVRCAPPDNKPTPGEIAACHDHLVAEAAALPRVRVLVCLGRIGFGRLAPARQPRHPRPPAPRVRARRGLPSGRRPVGDRVVSPVTSEHEYGAVDAGDAGRSVRGGQGESVQLPASSFRRTLNSQGPAYRAAPAPCE
jgi:uracil-DNA glycosylase family 4